MNLLTHRRMRDGTTSHQGGLTSRPSVSRARNQSPAAGPSRTGPLPVPSGGGLPLVEAKFQEGVGRVAGFWIATCPSCRSTKKVPGIDGLVTACTSCGAAFFTRRLV